MGSVQQLRVVRMHPERFTDWTQIKGVVERSAPPSVQVDDRLLTDVRRAMMDGELEGWMFINGNPMGIALTTIREDKLLGRRELIIYAAANIRNLTREEWLGCYALVKKHARGKNCTHVSFYSLVPRVLQVAKMLGGETDTRYVSLPIEGGDDA